MARLHSVSLSLVASFAFTAAAQSPAPTPKPGFDVAAIRQNKTEGPQHSNVPLDTGNVYAAIDPADNRTFASGYFVATNQPLWRYIAFAYRLSGTQELALRFSYFSGLNSKAPRWVVGGFGASAERFDIEARAPADSSIEEMRLMMQSLLADRFQLVVHRETRDAPALGLVLVHAGNPGPHLQPHPASESCAPPASDKDNPAPSSASSPGASSRGTSPPTGDLPPVCGVVAHVVSTEYPRTSFGARGVPISLLATSLPTMTGMAVVSRPVVDQTGLSGLYDFRLQWETSPDPETGDNAAFFRAALKSQLGLELKPTRGLIEILVIDKVEHPSAN